MRSCRPWLALTAAAQRQSPMRWRRASGSKTLTTHGSEALAWSHAAWLLADFLDFAREEEGATANLMTRWLPS
jgi:2-oxoglutarate dehydrogenase complex dehydrogenase (E1) component-like enzyme